MHKGFGFTLLEVMIFVAVSGFIFVFAVGSITSQQRRVQFSQSTREFEAKILDVINDVSTGYYPMNDQIDCTAGSAGQPPVLNSGGSAMGTNSACINIGKAIQFRPLIGSTQEDAKFYVYNLIGRRYSGDASEGVTVKNLAEAKPQAATNNAIENDAVDLAELRYGLEVTRVYSGDGNLSSTRDYATIAFVSNFEGGTVSSSQGQTIRVGAIRDTGDGSATYDPTQLTKQEAVQNVINNLTDAASAQGTTGAFEIFNQSTGIVICLEDTYGRKASLQLGKNGKSSTELKVDDYELGCD